MTYEMDIAGLKRELPLCRVTDDLYIGAFVMFGDVELTVHCAAELLKRAPEYDYIIAPEAKAIPLLYEMARQSGAEKYFLARKGAKAYMTGVFEVEVRSITTMHIQKLVIDTADAELIKALNGAHRIFPYFFLSEIEKRAAAADNYAVSCEQAIVKLLIYIRLRGARLHFKPYSRYHIPALYAVCYPFKPERLKAAVARRPVAQVIASAAGFVPAVIYAENLAARIRGGIYKRQQLGVIGICPKAIHIVVKYNHRRHRPLRPPLPLKIVKQPYGVAQAAAHAAADRFSRYIFIARL